MTPLPEEWIHSERSEALLTFDDDSLTTSKTDSFIGNLVDEGKDSEKPLSDARLIQAIKDSDDTQGAKDDLWLAIKADMRLNHHISEKRVKQEIPWLQWHPAYWARFAPRMQLYLPHILSQVQEKTLPAELTLLPVIGTALDPCAFSPSGASRLWQSMRHTAKQYGLCINDGYHGPRDVIDATDAALTYLQDLHKRFDDWQLALTAYNAGGGTVAKAGR